MPEGAESNNDAIDFLTEASIVDDPYPYFDRLRQRPVRPLPASGVVAVTGYPEAFEVFRDHQHYSSCNSFGGPSPGLPEPPDGDDISDLIERYRHIWPISEHLATFDPPLHTVHRALMMRLLTPRRVQESEPSMWRLADALIDDVADDGRCSFIRAYANPFALLTIAELLGVPESEHDLFRSRLAPAGTLDVPVDDDPFGFAEDLFGGYVRDRRRAPRDDVLTKLALATYADGSLPEVIDVVRIAVFLFAAGQGTTAHLLGTMLQRLAEQPALQDELRAQRERIPDFVEEMLRLESPVKANFRLVRRSTELGGVRLAAGTTVMILPGAANRDDRHFHCPSALELDRDNAREHLAFGRGAHACPGSALARAEARISLDRLLSRLSDIRIAAHVPGAPHLAPYRYEPSYMLRGLRSLHLEFTGR